MTREEFLKALTEKQEDIASILRKFVYTASREDIARVLIEYDYALWQAEKERECYLDSVVESLKEWWNE
jgi:hypothetical protein